MRRRRVSFLVQNYFGVGGTNTAVHNLAAALSDQSDVEVVSVFRRQDECAQPIAGRYDLRSLVDVRKGERDALHPLRHEASSLVNPAEEMFLQYNQLTDQRITDYLARTDAEVVITSRPSLNLLLARFGRDDYLRISQEHMTQDVIPEPVKDEVIQRYHRLDASVCLTVADAQALAVRLPSTCSVVSIPNAVPASLLPAAELDNHVVIAAGRLDPIKQYHVAIQAFAALGDRHPDWTMRLYGGGVEFARLREYVATSGWSDRILLMGRAAPLDAEWVKGSVALSTSSHESFGMTIVEAMRCGVPVVSTDCPVGPGEIIQNGRDGYLSPVGDVPALSLALDQLMSDEIRRKRMGRLASASAARFEPKAVADRYHELFESLRRPQRSWPRSARLRARRLADHLAADRSTAVGGGPSPRSVHVRRLLDVLSRSDGQTETAPVAARTFVDRAGDVNITLEAADDDQVVLRHRTRAHRDLVIDLLPQENGTMVRRAVLSTATPLADGRWGVYLRTGGTLLRVRLRSADTRFAVNAPLRRDDAEQVVRLPYRTADGFIAIRSWTRVEHAECRRIAFEGSSMQVDIELSGAALQGSTDGEVGALLTARSRELAVPALVQGTGSRRRVEIDLSLLVQHRLTRHDDWDLWVVLQGRRVRVERILDDIAERKTVHRQPLLSLPELDDYPISEQSPPPTIRMRAYFTVDSGLSVYVSEAD